MHARMGVEEDLKGRLRAAWAEVLEAQPAKRRKLHKRTGSRTFGKYPPNEPTIADILRRTGIATDLRRSTRRVGAMLAQASPLNRCPLVASCWRHVLCL